MDLANRPSPQGSATSAATHTDPFGPASLSGRGQAFAHTGPTTAGEHKSELGKDFATLLWEKAPVSTRPA